MSKEDYRLGSKESSEQLIKDLYLDLRTKLIKWSSLTCQTTQARMGYVGQHLVSVVTGYPGSRSGARGEDIVISKSEYAEIKTCYRVDQLGKCADCDARVASIEDKCPVCQSAHLIRNDDSKWLITIRNDDEFKSILDPKYYYLVLFEFADIVSESNTDIVASILRIDPTCIGFAYCMFDYYLNIRASSVSHAPFNLWPHSLKLDIMLPELLYESIIKEDNSIETRVFPGQKEPEVVPIKAMPEYARTTTLSRAKIEALAERLKIAVPDRCGKEEILAKIEAKRRSSHITDKKLADEISRVVYLPELGGVKAKIPAKFKKAYSELASL